MLTTLLEDATPGRAWPAWRESWALQFGGLRVRARQNHRLPTAANVRLSVMLGLAVSIALLGPASAGWPVAFGQQAPLQTGAAYLGAGLVLAAPALVRMRRQAVLYGDVAVRMASLTAAMWRDPAARDTRRPVR